MFQLNYISVLVHTWANCKAVVIHLVVYNKSSARLSALWARPHLATWIDLARPDHARQILESNHFLCNQHYNIDRTADQCICVCYRLWKVELYNECL